MNITLDGDPLTDEDFTRFGDEVRALFAKKSLQKGEGMGHEFRGNRYTGGIPGEATAAAERQEKRWVQAKSRYETLTAYDSKGGQILKVGGSKIGRASCRERVEMSV